MAISVDLLRNIPYFSGLRTSELDNLKNFFFAKTAERGVIIFIEGEPAESTYFVDSGMVKVFKTSLNGREQILSIVYPGETFNDIPIFDGGINLASAQAMERVALYGIRGSDLAVISRNNPQVAVNVARVLARQAHQLEELIEDLSFRRVNSRIAKLLLENSEKRDKYKSHFTHQELAAQAGTVREIAGKSLKCLADAGMIRLEQHRIVITDKKSLKDIADT
jgi:CRP/FNR family transcriptional regulator